MATLLQVQRFQGRPGGACFWYHRGSAIAALNKALSSENGQITDVMFCTVGMLAYLEVFWFPSSRVFLPRADQTAQTRVASLGLEMAGLHITALIRFLELRQGMLKVEMYCMLLRLAIW